MMSFFTENEYATYHIQDDILNIDYKHGVSINLAVAIRIVEDRLAFQQGLSFKILCDIRGVREIDKPARDYLAIEGSVLVVAVAYLIEPTVSRAISEFYISISNPPIPSRTFTELEVARQFLKEI